MIFAQWAWGPTPLVVLFAAAAMVGLLALGAIILLNLGVEFSGPVSSWPWWSWVTAVLLICLVFYVLSRQYAANRITRTVYGAGLAGALILILLTLPAAVFKPFFDNSGWTWLPLWTVWGWLGLWLLERKENPIRQPLLQGWVGDKVAPVYAWLGNVFEGAFKVLIEVAIIIFLLGVAAQLYPLLGHPIPALLTSFGNSPSVGLQVFVVALLFLVVGLIGRAGLGLAQTENIVDTIRWWRVRNRWFFNTSLGLGLIGLVAGSLRVILGPNLFKDWVRSLIAVSVLIVLGLAGWYLSKRKPSIVWWGHKAALTTLGFGCLFLLIAWGVLVRDLALMSLETSLHLKVLWSAATFALLFGPVGAWQTKGNKTATVTEDEVLYNATSWGFLLLAGIIAMALTVPVAVGRNFSPFLGIPPENKEIYAKAETNDALLDQVDWKQFGLWEQVVFIGRFHFSRTYTEGKDESGEISKVLPDANKPDANKINALRALNHALAQRDSLKFGAKLTALLIATLALVGLTGKAFLGLNWRSYNRANNLEAAEQLERIQNLARRKQRELVRRLTRAIAVILSFTFGLGLLAGVYIIATGLFGGDLSTALRNGALISAISWLGRRLLTIIPQDILHGGGYLVQAAGEIRQIINRSQPELPAMRRVP